MLNATQHLLAIAALLFGCVVGPDTHVHPGEGPRSEALVHAHAGIVGHTHSDRQGLSESGEGPAAYINAFSLTSCHARQLPGPEVISGILVLSVPRFAVGRIFLWAVPSAHAPPGVEFGHLRAPPFYLSV